MRLDRLANALRFEHMRNIGHVSGIRTRAIRGRHNMEFRNGDEAAMGLGDNGNTATLEADTPARAKAPNDKAVKMDRKDQGSDELVAEAAAQAMAGAMTEAVKAAPKDSKSVNPRRFTIETDSARDALLTDFGK